MTVIDFTIIDLVAKELETIICNRKLFGTRNGKQIRLPDKPALIHDLEDEDKKIILKRIPELQPQ